MNFPNFDAHSVQRAFPHTEFLRSARIRMPEPGENFASVVPRVVGPLFLPLDTMPSTEFVTNTTST